MKTIDEVLQAIIDGEEIQRIDDTDHKWYDAANKTILYYLGIGNQACNFRIKPKPLIYERSVSFVEDDKHCPVHMNKLPSGNNVKFIFDKSSKELIGVELIKE